MWVTERVCVIRTRSWLRINFIVTDVLGIRMMKSLNGFGSLGEKKGWNFSENLSISCPLVKVLYFQSVDNDFTEQVKCC